MKVLFPIWSIVFVFLNLPFQELKAQDYDYEGRAPFQRQDFKRGPQNVVKTSIFPFFISQNPLTAEFRVVYERVISNKQTIWGGVSMIYPNSFFQDTLQAWRQQYGIDFRMMGYRLQLGHKYYILKKKDAPRGLFFGPHISYNMAKFYEKGYPKDYLKIVYFNANVLFGYQLLAGGKVAMEFYTGLGYRNNYFVEMLSTYSKPVVENWQRGIKFTLATNIGFAF